MPLCSKCSKPFQCTCAAPDRQPVGAQSVDCPAKKPGAIWVHVTDDRGLDVKGVSASNDGASKPSTPEGLVIFDPVPAGKHTVDLPAPGDDIAKLYELPTGKTDKQVVVADGEISYVAYTVRRKPSLKVKVVEKGGATLFGGATVSTSGAGTHSKATEDATGLADIGPVSAGDFKIVATLKDDHQKTHVTSLDFTAAHVPVTLVAGQAHEALIEVEPLNVLKPVIETEYKVVLFDRGLSAHQGGSDVKLLPSATYIQVSVTQSNKAHPFTKTGKLEFTPVTGGAVSVFLDEECTKPLDKPLTAAQLLGATPVKLWLRGTAKGKYKVKLVLDDPADRFVKVGDDSGEIEMGVVELEMKVHWFVKADIDALADTDPDVDPLTQYTDALVSLALPEQKPLTDQQKVQEGRVLHTQSANGGFNDRARLLIKQLVADQWPDGCGGYKITLNKTCKTGDLTTYDAREDGKRKTDFSVRVSALKNADVERWVEGRKACKVAGDLRLDLGLDRSDGGLPKKPKVNADWARFTTVTIEEVKLDYVQEARCDNAWDKARKRYYININKKADPDGRKINISARLSEKIEGVPIYLMLAPDKDNMKTANWRIDFPADGRHFDVNANGTLTEVQKIKWKDVPVALKHKDRPDRKKLLHLGGKTDKEGAVKKELQLSRFGGDKFHPAAYLEQDPHLAKYVHGHNVLKRREPVFAADRPIQVWRKMYYEAIEPQANNLPAGTGIQDTQRKVFLEPELTATRKMTAADFKIDPYRPHWQFRTGVGNALKLCIGDHNVDQARKLIIPATEATSPKLHAFVCDEQFDAKGVETDAKQVMFDDPNPKDVALQLNNSATGFAILDPPLQGGPLIVSATWEMKSYDTALITGKTKEKLRHTGTTVPAANVTLDSGRASVNMIRLTPPTSCGGAADGCACGGKPTTFPIDARHKVWVTIQVLAATGPWGGWAPNGGVPTVVLKRKDTAETANTVEDTFGHELGHKFGQTRHARLAGLPDHPKYYQRRGGSGSHCSETATFQPNPAAPPLNPTVANSLDAMGHGAGTYANGRCILWHSASAWKREWCKHCALDFIHSDLSTFT